VTPAMVITPGTRVGKRPSDRMIHRQEIFPLSTSGWGIGEGRILKITFAHSVQVCLGACDVFRYFRLVSFALGNFFMQRRFSEFKFLPFVEHMAAGFYYRVALGNYIGYQNVVLPTCKVVSTVCLDNGHGSFLRT